MYNRLHSKRATYFRQANGVTCVVTNHIWSVITESLLSLSREEISDIVPVLTDHNLYGRHAQRLRLLSPDFCRICGTMMRRRALSTLTANAMRRCRMISLGSAFFHDPEVLLELTFHASEAVSTVESDR